eukprot:jgi/Mesvir1/19130/Mv12869-RA.1
MAANGGDGGGKRDSKIESVIATLPKGRPWPTSTVTSTLRTRDGVLDSKAGIGLGSKVGSKVVQTKADSAARPNSGRIPGSRYVGGSGRPTSAPVKPRPKGRLSVKDLPKHDHLQDVAAVADKGAGYRPPWWSDQVWGKPECDPGPAVLRASGKSPAKGSTSPTAGANVSMEEFDSMEKSMRSVLTEKKSLHQGPKEMLLRMFRSVATTVVSRVTLNEFIEAWRRLGVTVSPPMATAFFRRYGMDKQGMLPYQVFARALLTPPSKLLGFQDIKRGAFSPEDPHLEFYGKILYPECRKGVFAPTDWDPELGKRSAEMPKGQLKLEFVYGYSGFTTSPNLFYTASNEIVYFTAGVGIVYNKEQHTQRFFLSHNDDIHSLAIHPDRNIVATGQVAHRGDKGDPYVCVWDTTTLEELSRIYYDDVRGMVALSFSRDGTKLAAVGTDNQHTIFIHEWATKKLIAECKGCNGEPPQVFGILWNPYADNEFISYGVNHIKWWKPADTGKGEGGGYSATVGSFGTGTRPFNILSACCLPSGRVLTGNKEGSLCVWQGSKLVKQVEAHPSKSVITEMTSREATQGLYCIAMRREKDSTVLITAGSDGWVHHWDVSSGGLGNDPRPLSNDQYRSYQLKSPYAGEPPPVFKGLDVQPGTNVFVAGTSKCEIWEVDADPELLIAGHNADLYHVDWHPVEPSVFVTACESKRVFLWDAAKRKLTRTTNVGFAFRVAVFSKPDGKHIAVGGRNGKVVILQSTDLRPLREMHDDRETITDMKYSPSGHRLAVASHDLSIELYDVTNDYAHVGHCVGHSSAILHIDWCVASRYLQSNCQSYEILYWDSKSTKQSVVNHRDTKWDTYTCILGFPVMGIWMDDSDGTDINAVDVSHGRDYVVTADDFSNVRLLNYPSVVTNAPARVYKGHSSHVMCARFNKDDKWVVSAGSKDRAAFQWRTHAIARSPKTGQLLQEEDPDCDVEGCEACQKEPPPPPPQRIWGPLDNTGVNFGYIDEDKVGKKAPPATVDGKARTPQKAVPSTKAAVKSVDAPPMKPASKAPPLPAAVAPKASSPAPGAGRPKSAVSSRYTNKQGSVGDSITESIESGGGGDGSGEVDDNDDRLGDSMSGDLPKGKLGGAKRTSPLTTSDLSEKSGVSNSIPTT